MKQEQVIEWARSVGARAGLSSWVGKEPPPKDFFISVCQLQRFAALVASAEREACAKGCDDAALGFGEETEWAQGYVQGIRDVAEGIRARGGKEGA